VAVVGRLVRQNEKYSTKGETIHKKHKSTEYTKYKKLKTKNKHKNNIKKVSRVI
jgi:hypothetical protein